jgi:pimeloyl-ACP methyl ester carboxylesterase
MLVMTGDEDHPCLQPGLFLKQVVASAALLVIPNTGHTINLEVPEAFNAALQDLITQVEAGRWPLRDLRAISDSITGVKA